jgi:predicted unusual protein kinase regulating ubiquinone biosynthesis (AarF/ABC1/UbiB family)
VFRARYRRIVFFFARSLAALGFWELALPLVGLSGLARRTRPQRLRCMAARFRALAVRMGGVLIKVGQFLSSRLDLLPDEITSELAGLQDEVPPEDFAAIRRVAEAELGAPLAKRFLYFDETPLAAASLGQVHRARLRTLESADDPTSDAALPAEVVVKIQRPRIEQLIAIDLAALATVGRWLSRYPPIRRRADIPALLSEFTRILHEEIDYLTEGKNAETFAAHFADHALVRVPRVVWSHTTRRVLTLEDVYGIKVTDHASLSAAGVDPAEVSTLLFATYMKQIFRDGFFHGDPHPGNLFITVSSIDAATLKPTNARWRLTFVDFGMVGRVTPTTRAGLREAVIAIGTKDAAKLVRAWQGLGVLLPGADIALLERVEARVFERFWGKTMAELRDTSSQEMRALLREFRGLIYKMPFQIPLDLILLGWTMGILSGMCTGLDPSFNAWTHVAPFAQELIAEDRRNLWEGGLETLRAVVRALLDVPQRADRVLATLERGEISIRMPELTEQVTRLEVTLRRLLSGFFSVGFLLAGLQLNQAGHVTYARVFYVGAALSLVICLLTRSRASKRPQA